jgi:hypothetical protein
MSLSTSIDYVFQELYSESLRGSKHRLDDSSDSFTTSRHVEVLYRTI